MMSDPFQAKKMPARPQQIQAVGPLRDTSPDARLLRPRSKRLLRAIKMLDLLTAGDEGLHTYLSARAKEAKSGQSFDPFAAQRGVPQPTVEDPLDAMTQTPPPPADSQEFQQQKEELGRQCREIVQTETAQEDSVVYLAYCSLRFHRIHWVDAAGKIMRHYRPEDLNTPLLRMADELLHRGYILLEVHGSFPDAKPGTVLYAANEAGEVEKVIF